MRAVIQRVNWAKVTVDNEVVGEIKNGILVLIGIISSDNDSTIDYMLDKIVTLRIFEDENNKMNLSLKDIGGELFIVPNFTLYADARKGKRPSYSLAATPREAEIIFNMVVEKAKSYNIKSAFGIFQAEMKIELLNDGPVTILLDSEKLF